MKVCVVDNTTLTLFYEQSRGDFYFSWCGFRISDSYERRSVIITTNLEFSRWVSIFYDEQMTAAMIDRLVHHSYLLLFDGQSNRVRNSLMKSAG